MKPIQMPPRKLPVKELQDAIEDEEEGDHLAHARGPLRRRAQVASDAPENRAQHAPAVQREAGDQVEDAEQQV